MKSVKRLIGIVGLLSFFGGNNVLPVEYDSKKVYARNDPYRGCQIQVYPPVKKLAAYVNNFDQILYLDGGLLYRWNSVQNNWNETSYNLEYNAMGLPYYRSSGYRILFLTRRPDLDATVTY